LYRMLTRNTTTVRSVTSTLLLQHVEPITQLTKAKPPALMAGGFPLQNPTTIEGEKDEYIHIHRFNP